MNRNTESRFSKVPVIKAARSSFPLNYTHLTTMNAGKLVPFFVQEVLPGDTFSYDMATLVRLSSAAIHPTMDNLFMDTYFFWVPNRIIYDNWKKFMGESPEPWVDSNTYVPPTIDFGSSTNAVPGSLWAYLGNVPVGSLSNLPTGKSYDTSILPFNAYCMIWNYYFRVQSVQPEVPIYKGDGQIPTSYLSAYKSFVGVSSMLSEESCLPVAKTADYFVSCLPSPQKGPDVLIPTGGRLKTQEVHLTNGDLGFGPYVSTSPLASGIVTKPSRLNDGNYYLKADISGSSTALGLDIPNAFGGLEITVNNLRLAIQTQRLLEKDARGGSFYNQILKNHFNIDVNSNVIDIPEYLGGKRIPINMLEVTQTTPTSTSPLGNLAGKSVTADKSNLFTKSFVEHGFVIGVCCIRTDHTYAQGIEKMFIERQDRLSYYWPVFAHLGEMPVYNRNIQANCSNPDEVFGYQEAWAEYRYKPNRISGYFAPQISGSLSSWHYGDNYTGTTAPKLSDSWIRQGTAELDRTLAVPSATMHQFLVDFYVKGKMVRAMPVYSIPGLMDHE